VLETILKEVQIEREEEKKHAKKIEQIIEEVFQMIPNNVLTRDLNVEEKIKMIE
jgi:hypothetical protein